MPDILHRVGINASADRVYLALASILGLRQWWTHSASGSTEVGDVIDFGFCKMKVVDSKPRRIVRWKCVAGPKEWIGTQVSFELKRKQNQTFILFKHAKWKKPVEFMHHCSTKWATFLLSLRDWVEQGQGRPAPQDVKIHVGD